MGIGHRINQVRSLLPLLANKQARHAFRTWRPFSITSYQIFDRLSRVVPDLQTIVDGGANIGQFSRAALEFYPAARIFAFEPLPEEALRFRDYFRDEPRVSLFQAALGEQDGRLMFHKHEYSLESSALPLNQDRTSGKSVGAVTVQIEVAAIRLDKAVSRDQISSPSLLKLDVQGFEIPALRGASGVLDCFDYLLLEGSFLATYEGEALFHELLRFANDEGFLFERPVDFLTNANGDIVQMDSLFRRKK
jgi:FkbM family methyltransferase